nr:PREDICTED: dehydrogenase/reductase SDR family member on chromosome X-like [Equus przewalskii]
MQSIRQFVQKFQRKRIPLHVLVNNAGVMMVPQRKTVDGFEEHLGLNYLGHFLLTNLLLDTLRDSGCPGRSARVVTVSSATHYVGELNLADLQGRWVEVHGCTCGICPQCTGHEALQPRPLCIRLPHRNTSKLCISICRYFVSTCLSHSDPLILCIGVY